MALTLHVWPGDRGTVVWISGDVDFNAADAFQDMPAEPGRTPPPLPVRLPRRGIPACWRRPAARNPTCLAVWGMASARCAGWLGLIWVIAQ